MFSQRDEEKYIIEFFKSRVSNTSGRFLDIGAYDGKTFSTTRQLARNGWGGVLVEPCPQVLHSLKKLYGDDFRYKIITKGVGLQRGIFTFYNFYGDAVGSFDRTHAELWAEKGKRKWKEIQVEVITVEDLFSEIGYKFDFLNLDIEGWSLDVLAEIPFEQITQLKMICVEFDHQEKKVLNLTGDYGFVKLHRTAENLLLIRE